MLSSARVLKRMVNSLNERNPYFRLNFLVERKNLLLATGGRWGRCLVVMIFMDWLHTCCIGEYKGRQRCEPERNL